MSETNPLNLAKIQEELAKLPAPKFWKSLEELAGTEKFQQYLTQEYPNGAADFSDPISRRKFLKVMGASIFLASFTGCKPPPLEKIVPYRKMPEEIIPGKALFFATAIPWNRASTGLLVESNMGRPTKIEGNPEHPDSLGATHAVHQASILGLYDPDRSKVVLNRGSISTWEKFLTQMEIVLNEQKTNNGSGLRLLTEPVLSPTLANQIQEVLKKYPQAKWHQYEPVHQDFARRAQKAALGQYADPLYSFNQADVILSLESDFLVSLPGSLRYAKEFAKKRQSPKGAAKSSRFYQIEGSPTLTGANADHKFPIRSSEIEEVALFIASELGIQWEGISRFQIQKDYLPWIKTIVEDLKVHKGKSLILVGDNQPPVVHALAYAMNQALENVGKTITFIDPIESTPVENLASIQELQLDMEKGLVDVLFIVGGNPAYNVPANLNFSDHLKKVKHSVHLSLYEDETSSFTKWHIPQAHFLETFSDGRASEGTATFLQPLIEPLYQGKSEHELVGLLAGQPGVSGEEAVKNYWKSKWPTLDFSKAWRKALHDGVAKNSASKPKNIIPKTIFNQEDQISLGFAKKPTTKNWEISFHPDPSIWDGRFANNAWLQELPKPLTKLTWDNAALIAPLSAQKLGVANEDMIEVTVGNESLEIPVWITPGQAENSLTLFLGFGRKLNAHVANQQGFNVYPLRTVSQSNIITDVQVKKTGKKYPLATTQHHHNMEGRNLIRTASVAEYEKNHHFAQDAHHHDGPLPSLYPEFAKKEYAWGMSINLNACIGCNACVVACQSENNIPVVGKEEVRLGREMHWLRIDSYYEGSLNNPKTHHQPVLCQHCENAPCEPVCPVGATVHSDEGLNEMVYNRCVGTRYCSNNCPYKVRHFNFYEYADSQAEALKLMRNPNVTVRSRGVMEKCTFCVQRINRARIESEKENRSIRDGEIVTACQASCPTEAISFGNIQDAEAKVTQLKKSPLDYGLLTELNTRPRVTYLAKVTNPHPEIQGLA